MAHSLFSASFSTTFRTSYCTALGLTEEGHAVALLSLRLPRPDSSDASVARRHGVGDQVLHRRLAMLGLHRDEEIDVPFGVHHLQTQRTTLRYV